MVYLSMMTTLKVWWQMKGQLKKTTSLPGNFDASLPNWLSITEKPLGAKKTNDIKVVRFDQRKHDELTKIILFLSEYWENLTHESLEKLNKTMTDDMNILGCWCG